MSSTPSAYVDLFDVVCDGTTRVTHTGKRPTVHCARAEDAHELMRTMYDGELPRCFYRGVKTFWDARGKMDDVLNPTSFTNELEMQVRDRFERAHVMQVFRDVAPHLVCVEPGCGVGRWTKVLAEYFDTVRASEIVRAFVDTMPAYDNVDLRLETSHETVSRQSQPFVLFLGGLAPYMSNKRVLELLAHPRMQFLIALESVCTEAPSVLLLEYPSERFSVPYNAVYRDRAWWRTTLKGLGFELRYYAEMAPPADNRSSRFVALWSRVDGEGSQTGPSADCT